MGCGPQETFRACSDIRILDTGGEGDTTRQKLTNKDGRKKIKVIRKKVIGVKHFKPYLLSVITLNERKSNKVLRRNTFKDRAKKHEQIKTQNQRYLHDNRIIDNLINTILTCKAVGNILSRHKKGPKSFIFQVCFPECLE